MALICRLAGKSKATKLLLVISDSIPWREQLLTVAGTLERRKHQRRWTERTSFLVERDIMVSAYAVRKLCEARKVSDELSSRKWAVSQHVLVGRPPDLWSRFEPWEHYDFESSNDVDLGLTELCNQIIHSWVWMISATTLGKFDGVYVSSDRQRRRCLYFIHVDELIRLFKAVGAEHIVEFTMRRDDNGEMQYTRIIGVPFNV